MSEKDRKITAVSPAMSSPELRRAINQGKGQEVGVTHKPGENPVRPEEWPLELDKEFRGVCGWLWDQSETLETQSRACELYPETGQQQLFWKRGHF